MLLSLFTRQHKRRGNIWCVLFRKSSKNPGLRGIYEHNRWRFDNYECADGCRRWKGCGFDSAAWHMPSEDSGRSSRSSANTGHFITPADGCRDFIIRISLCWIFFIPWKSLNWHRLSWQLTYFHLCFLGNYFNQSLYYSRLLTNWASCQGRDLKSFYFSIC